MKKIAIGLIMVWAAAGLASASLLVQANFNDTNGVSSLATGVPGKSLTQNASGSLINTGLSPNNTTGYVGATTGGTPFSLATATYQFPTVKSFTIGGWFCRTGAVTGANANIFGNSGGTAGFGINLTSAGQYRLGVEGTAFATQDGTLALDTWTFIAITYDGSLAASNVKYYSATSTNSLIVGSTRTLNQGDINAATAALTLGGSSVANYMVGKFDDLRIYTSTTDSTGVISAGEITTWMQGADAIPEPATIGMLGLGAILVMIVRRSQI